MSLNVLTWLSDFF